MKNFKNLSVISAFVFALGLSACAGITDANYSDANDKLSIEVQDLQDQNPDIHESGGQEPEMIRVRPD